MGREKFGPTLRTLGAGMELLGGGMDLWNQTPWSAASKQDTYGKLLQNLTTSGGIVSEQQMQGMQKHMNINLRPLVRKMDDENYRFYKESQVDALAKAYAKDPEMVDTNDPDQRHMLQLFYGDMFKQPTTPMAKQQSAYTETGVGSKPFIDRSRTLAEAGKGVVKTDEQKLDYKKKELALSTKHQILVHRMKNPGKYHLPTYNAALKKVETKFGEYVWADKTPDEIEELIDMEYDMMIGKTSKPKPSPKKTAGGKDKFGFTKGEEKFGHIYVGNNNWKSK